MISRLSAFMNKPQIAEHLIYKKERIVNILKEFGYNFTKKDLYRFQMDNNLPVENYIGNEVVVKLEELKFNKLHEQIKKINHSSKSFPTIKCRRGSLKDIASIELNTLDLGDIVLIENKIFYVAMRPSGQKYLHYLSQMISNEKVEDC